MEKITESIVYVECYDLSCSQNIIETLGNCPLLEVY
jgi:hypothetical protein